MILAASQLATAMALTGLNVPVGKILAAELPVALIIFLRCVVAVAVLLPLARWLEPATPRPRGKLAWNLAGQAALGTALYNAALLAGLARTSALEAGLVLAAMPAVVALGAWALLREHLAARQWAAVALAGIGIFALNLAGGGGDAAGGSPAGGSLAGNALVLLAVCAEAGYALLSKRSAGATGVFTATLWMQGFSLAILAPVALPQLLARLGAGVAPGWVLWLVAFHGLTASVLHLVLWYSGMRRVPAGLAGVFSIFLPATAALSGIALLGERPGVEHVLGFGLMIGSVLLATWPRR